MDTALKKLILNYTKYNHWANENMVRWLKSIDSTILNKEVTSSFSSIDFTMQHMNHAQNFWFAVITETDITELDERMRFNAAHIIMNELLAGSEKFYHLCEAYTEEELIKPVSTGVTVQRRYDFILHMVNHNSYHRGQIITISRTLGITENVPLTDYEFFLWS